MCIYQAACRVFRWFRTREQMNNTLGSSACQLPTRPRACLHDSSFFVGKRSRRPYSPAICRIKNIPGRKRHRYAAGPSIYSKGSAPPRQAGRGLEGSPSTPPKVGLLYIGCASLYVVVIYFPCSTACLPSFDVLGTVARPRLGKPPPLIWVYETRSQQFLSICANVL